MTCEVDRRKRAKGILLRRVQFFGFLLRALAQVEADFVVMKRTNSQVYPDIETYEWWIENVLSRIREELYAKPPKI